MIIFEIIFGIKINFHKRLLVDVNVEESYLLEVIIVLNCKFGRVSFVYFEISFCRPILDNIRKRLLGSKSKNMCIGGHLVLIKSILSSLAVYFLSFFKTLICIISIIESLFYSFLRGGRDARKINRMQWGKICANKELGGRGVRKVKVRGFI